MGAQRRDEGSEKEAEKMKAKEQREAGKQAEEEAAGAGSRVEAASGEGMESGQKDVRSRDGPPPLLLTCTALCGRGFGHARLVLIYLHAWQNYRCLCKSTLLVSTEFTQSNPEFKSK